MGYDWKTDEYIELVEHTTNPFLREYIDAELRYITTGIKDSTKKTFIDVGAGYGRVIPSMAGISNKVLAIEREIIRCWQD